MDGARAGDSLQRYRLMSRVSIFRSERGHAAASSGETYSVLFDGRAIGAEDELPGRRSEVRQSGDREVLMVEAWIIVQDLIRLKIA